MEKFFEKIGNVLAQKDYEYVRNTYNLMKDKYKGNDLESQRFAVKIAEAILDNRLDYKSIVVGLMYPIFRIEPSIVDLDIFDEEIKGIFNRIAKIDNLNLTTHQEQLDNIKNMFIALAKDIRVIIIKLCIEESKLDFIDNMSEELVENYMKSVSDVYFPLCQMLGLNTIKNNFGNATFKYYKPAMYKELSEALNTFMEERNNNIQEVISRLKTELVQICPNAVVYGRQKQLFSIAKKLQSKNMAVSTITDIYGRNNYLHDVADNVSFNENKLNQIMDILAVRILVDRVEECYAALGKVFTTFKPLGNFKDYIANPKENGYQSLHTAIVLDNGDPVEVQIRTFDMHTYAEYGFAAHWAYKEKKKVDESGVKINYIRSIMDLHKEKSNDELLEIMNTDVYSGKIFVQSPQGKIIEFPEGATPIDFAYAIHSNIGNTCVGAKINDRMVPLSTPMNNGDIIEIITNPNSNGPSRDWLKLAKTSSAKSKINTFFKKAMKEENIKKGKAILENYAKTKALNLSKLLVNEYLEELYEKYSFQGIDDMYASLGFGSITAGQVLNKLNALYKADNKELFAPNKEYQLNNIKNEGDIEVKGFSNLLTKLAKCCSPLPGDDIIGYISRGNGVTIHRRDCEALKNYEFERLIECSWNTTSNKNFVGSITIIATDTPGLVSVITKKLNDEKINMVGLLAKKIEDNKVVVTIHLNIKDKADLDALIVKIKQLNIALEVYRTN
ncbi:MAG: bifunctional (p)ppGpp synthetase/guanosine-3',5'-bis(diphosphate) 3'-pyrophosphohydrolase [Clostridiales bacterium]|nr:bifunctional (p)ppGpp synthetase/guanosine-3',5'-bis(diphosphate) 3'-pyrophosphohydrolase [Clostridiales bacterium]